MKERTTKIFLADDHHIFREGIRALLEQDGMIEVAGEAANGVELMAMLSELELDLILLDINMPEISGLELIKQLSLNYSLLPVLVLSTHDDEQYIHHMMTQGAKGYLLKNCKKEELIMAIKMVSSGGTYMSNGVSKKLFNAFRQKEEETKKTKSIPLTNRELEVLKLVALGMTNQAIGKQLFISPRTVDTHRRNMMTKLDLHNAVALTNYATQNGLFKIEK